MNVLFATAGKPTAPIASEDDKDAVVYFHPELSPEGWLSFFYVTAWEQVFHGVLTTPERTMCVDGQPASVQYYCKRWQEVKNNSIGATTPRDAAVLLESVLELASNLFNETHRNLIQPGATERGPTSETLRRALEDDTNAILIMFRLWCVKALIGPVNEKSAPVCFGDAVRKFLQEILVKSSSSSSAAAVSAQTSHSSKEEEDTLHTITALHEFLCLAHGTSDVRGFVVPPPMVHLDDSEPTRWTRAAEKIVDAAPALRTTQSSIDPTVGTPLEISQTGVERQHAVKKLSVRLAMQYALARVYTVLLLPQWGSVRQLCARRLSDVISTLSCGFSLMQGCGPAPLAPSSLHALPNPSLALLFRPLETAARQAVSFGVVHEILECVAVYPMIAVPTTSPIEKQATSAPPPQPQSTSATSRLVSRSEASACVQHLVDAEQRRQRIVSAMRVSHGSLGFQKTSWIAPSHAALLLCALVDSVASAAASAAAIVESALQSVVASADSSNSVPCDFQRFGTAIVEASTRASMSPVLFCTPAWSTAYTAATYLFPVAADHSVSSTDPSSESGNASSIRTAPAQVTKASSRATAAFSNSKAHLSGSGTKVVFATLLPQSTATAVVDTMHELLFSLIAVPAPQDFHSIPPSPDNFFSTALLRLRPHTRGRVELLKASVSGSSWCAASEWPSLVVSKNPGSVDSDLDTATHSLALLLSSAESTAHCICPGIRTAEQSDAFLLELFPTLLQQMGYEWPWSELLRQLKQLTRQRQNDLLNNADAFKSDQRHIASPAMETLHHLLADVVSQKPTTNFAKRVGTAELLRFAALQIESSLASVERPVWSQGHLRFFDRDGATPPTNESENEASLLARLFADVLMHRTYWARLEQILPISFDTPVVDILSPLFNPGRAMSAAGGLNRGSSTVFSMPSYYAVGGKAVVDYLLLNPYVFAVTGTVHNTTDIAASFSRGGGSLRVDQSEWMGDSRSLVEEAERRLYASTNACELVLKVKTSHSLSSTEKVKLTARYTTEVLIAALICIAFTEAQKESSSNESGGGSSAAHRAQYNWLNTSSARSKLQWLLRCFAPLLERLQMEIEFGVSSGDRRQTDTQAQGGEHVDGDDDSDADDTADSADPSVTVASLTCCKGLDSPFLVCKAATSVRRGQGLLSFHLTPAAEDLCHRCGYSFYPLEWAADVASVTQDSVLKNGTGAYAWGMGSQMNVTRMPYSPFAAVAHQLRLHWGEETQHAASQGQQNLVSAPQLTRSLADTLSTYRFLEALLGCMYDTREPGAVSYARDGSDKSAARSESRGVEASKRARGVMTLWASTQAKRTPAPDGNSQSKELPSSPHVASGQSTADPSVFCPTHTVVKAVDVLAATYQCMLPHPSGDSKDEDEVTENQVTPAIAEMKAHIRRISAMCQSRAQSWRWNKKKMQQQATEILTILLNEVDVLRHTGAPTAEPPHFHEALLALKEKRVGERIRAHLSIGATSGAGNSDASGALLAAVVALAATIAPQRVSAEVFHHAARTVARYAEVEVNSIAERSAYSVDAEPYARRIISKWSLRVSEYNAQKKSLLNVLRECSANSSVQVQLASSLEEEMSTLEEVLRSLYPSSIAVDRWSESVSQGQVPANQSASSVWRAATLSTLEQLLSAVEEEINVPLSSPLSLLVYSTVGFRPDRI